MNDQSLFLAIDVGTGSVRAALVDRSGAILKLVGREHQQIVPHYGWAEQRPEDWWSGATSVIRQVLAAVPDAANRIEAVCACGQMHGTVLIDSAGQLTRDTAPLWNDKRPCRRWRHSGSRIRPTRISPQPPIRRRRRGRASSCSG
mgnify:CR=1 FL=1